MKQGVLIVLVVAVILGIWYFGGWHKASPSPSVSTSPTVSPSPVPHPTTTRPASKSPTPNPSISPVSSGATPSISPAVSPTVTVTSSPTFQPSPSISAGVATYTVTIQDITYSPTPLTVRKGDLVIFYNGNTFTQTATAYNRTFDSRNIRAGTSWTLDTSTLQPGTYDYYSTLHPTARGTLIVQ